jgi:uncharacterized membrane protein
LDPTGPAQAYNGIALTLLRAIGFWANSAFLIKLHTLHCFIVNVVISRGVQTDIKPSEIRFIALNISKHLLLPRHKLIYVKEFETAHEM